MSGCAHCHRDTPGIHKGKCEVALAIVGKLDKGHCSKCRAVFPGTHLYVMVFTEGGGAYPLLCHPCLDVHHPEFKETQDRGEGGEGEKERVLGA